MKSYRFARMWSPVLVLTGSLVLTAFAAYQVSVLAAKQDDLRFANSVNTVYNEINNRMETYISLLRGASGLFAASDVVTREDFQAFITRLSLSERYPGIQGIGVAKKVDAGDRGAFEARMRATAWPDFKITPPGARDEYYPIIYLEPLDRRNRVAIGYDMFTHEVRRAAMERARDKGEVAASGRVQLVQEIDDKKQAGFLIYLPMYIGGKIPLSVDARRAAFFGFVYSPFRADDLLQGILGNRELNIDFEVYDGKEVKPEALLHRSNPALDWDHPSHRPLLMSSNRMEVAGQPWTLRYATQPAFEAQSTRHLARYILLSGLIISLALFAVTRAQAKARAVAERVAGELRASQGELTESEERYRTITETASDAIITIDEQHRILFVNRAAEQIFGYAPQELYGRPLTMLMPDDEPSRQRYIGAGREGAKRVEVRGRRRDGSDVPLEVSFGEFVKGGQRFFTGVLRDIAERKQAEAARAHLAAIVESSDDAIISKNLQGVITSWNRGAERMFGYTTGEIVGQPITVLIPTHRAEEEPQIVESIRSGERMVHYETTRRRKDGTEFDVSLTVSPIRNERGEVIGASKILRDITARKRVEEELRVARDELELRVAERTAELALANGALLEENAERRRAEASLQSLNVELERSNRELQDFAFVASHDLQEPLRKIQAFGDLLKNQYTAALGAEGADFIERMQKAARRMHTLINDLLTFSRVTTKAQPFVSVDLSEVAREVLDDLETRVRQTGGRVELGPLPTLDADPLQMRQLLQNLIGNALKFHRPDAPPVVRVSGATSANNHGRLVVQDNGIGFDEKYLDRIFTPFQRLHSRGEYEGTGMGLAVCRKIVERHGGHITAHSRPGEGSEFVIELPVKHSEEERRA